MKPQLSVIIVNFNAGRWLQDCLRSVLHKAKGLCLETVIVDNQSTDGSLTAVPEKFPQARVIQNGRNLGFAKAANQGINASKGKYVLLLNPDTTALNDGLRAWLQYMDEHPEVGISGPKVYDDETRSSVQLSCRRFPSLINYFFNRYSWLSRWFPRNRFSKRYLMSHWSHDETSPVDWVSGCCMLLRRDMLEEVGLLDERYPLYVEDVDICYRAHQAGWKVIYFPGMEIAHHTTRIGAQSPYRVIVLRHLSLWRFCNKLYQNSPFLKGVVPVGIVARMAFQVGLTAFKRLLPVLVDVGFIQASVALSFLVRHLWEFPWTQRALVSYLDIAAGYTLIQILLLYFFELYRRPAAARQDDYLDILPQVIKASSLGMLMLVFTAFFNQQFVLPRSIVIFSWLFNIPLLTGWRWAALYWERKRLPPKRVLIYGTGALAALVEDELNRLLSLRYEPIGFIRPGSSTVIAVEPSRVLGTLEELAALAKSHRIDELVFAAEERQEREVYDVMDACHAVHVNTRLAPDLFETVLGNTHLEHFQVPFLDPEFRRSRIYVRLKRGLDVAGAALLLILAGPWFGLIALKIKRGRGPIFSRQARVGLNGRVFTLYKFRKTPYANGAQEALVQMTPFGRFLRLTRLDELPQLLNVLKGEMSLVGPQPEPVEVAREMERALPCFAQRYRLRPGLTGWAQVELRYPTTTEKYRQKLQYDLYYVKNASLALDFKILLKSLWLVITGRGVR